MADGKALSLALELFSRSMRPQVNSWMVAIVSTTSTRRWVERLAELPLAPSRVLEEEQLAKDRSCGSCGLLYRDSDNTQTSCKYHPGCVIKLDGAGKAEAVRGLLEDGVKQSDVVYLLGLEDSSKGSTVKFYYSCCGQRTTSSGCHTRHHSENALVRTPMSFAAPSLSNSR